VSRSSQKPFNKGARPSYAALIAIVIALIACGTVAVALIGTGEDEESVAPLQWVEAKRIPDSLLIEIPNSFGHEMGILEPELRATAANSAGESLFAVAATLWMDAGSPIEDARARCSIGTRKDAEVARGTAASASYPRPGKLTSQLVPGLAQVHFDSGDAELVTVDLSELIGDQFATAEGIELEWPSSKPGEQRFEWILPPEPSSEELELRFASVWKTTSVPVAKIACSLTTRDGTVVRRTGGALPSS
jgi:hypothetical protein